LTFKVALKKRFRYQRRITLSAACLPTSREYASPLTGSLNNLPTTIKKTS